MFTKSGFSDKKCTKIFFVFGWGSAPDPLRELWRSPDLLVNWGEIPQGIPPPHSPFPSTYSASRCPVQFFKCDHLATIDRKLDSLIQKFCSFVGNCSRTRRRTTRIRWTIDTHGSLANISISITLGTVSSLWTTCIHNEPIQQCKCQVSARVLILDCSQQLVCRISSDYKYSYWTANTAVINRPVYSQKNKYRQHHGTKPTVTMYILELHGYKTQTTPQIRQCTCRPITFSLKYFTTLYLLNLSPVLLTIVMLATCILTYLCAILVAYAEMTRHRKHT